MTKSGIEKRKDYKLALKGKRRIKAVPNGKKSEFNISHRIVSDPETDKRVKAYFNSIEQGYRNEQTVKRLGGVYRRYNKPKTNADWRAWYKIKPLRVSYLDVNYEE